jgi:hypothetical protein
MAKYQIFCAIKIFFVTPIVTLMGLFNTLCISCVHIHGQGLVLSRVGRGSSVSQLAPAAQQKKIISNLSLSFISLAPHELFLNANPELVQVHFSMFASSTTHPAPLDT